MKTRGLAVALETFAYLADPVGWFERAGRTRGPVFRAETWPYGPEVFIGDPEVARAVFASRTMLGGRANVALRHVVGEESVSSLDGAAHAERRHLLVDVLAAGRARFGAGAARERTTRELAAMPVSDAMPLGPLLRRVVMGAMLEAVFGEATLDVRELGLRFARLVERGAVPFAQLGVLPALRRDFPLSPWRAFSAALADVDARLYAEVARGGDGGGMLGALHEARGSRGLPLATRVLRDELFTLLGAGYETTSTSLEWALEAILLRPDIAAGIAGGDEALLDAAIRESLRLRPTLPTVRRFAAAPFDADGMSIIPGESAVLAVHMLHRAGLDDPGRFDPSRRFDPRAFFAFGGGARRCPGITLALEHMRGVVGALVPALGLVRARPSRPIFRGATLAPARPVLVRRQGRCPVR